MKLKARSGRFQLPVDNPRLKEMVPSLSYTTRVLLRERFTNIPVNNNNNKLKFAIFNILSLNRTIINVDFIFLISGLWRDPRNV